MPNSPDPTADEYTTSVQNSMTVIEIMGRRSLDAKIELAALNDLMWADYFALKGYRCG